MRFKEEQTVLSSLLAEWYDAMREVAVLGDGVFSEKARHYDRISPVWHRIGWPDGFVQELRKKSDRVEQLLQPGNGEVNWDEVNEELVDIANYSKMFHALNLMVERRKESAQ